MREAPNDMNIKSLLLVLAGPQPHYEVEAYAGGAGESDPKFTGPIGLDALYRKGN